MAAAAADGHAGAGGASALAADGGGTGGPTHTTTNRPATASLANGHVTSPFFVSERAMKGPIFSMAVTTTHVFVGYHNGIIVGFSLGEVSHTATTPASSSSPLTGDATAQDDASSVEMAAHNGVVRQVTVHGATNRLFSCSSDGSIKCWRVPDCAWEMSYEGHSDGVHGFVVDAKGTRLYSGDAAGIVMTWDVASGERLQVMRCHYGAITCLTIPVAPPPKEDAGPDEEVVEPPRPNCILTGSSDTLVKLIEPATKTVHVLIKAEVPVCTVFYLHPLVVVGGSDGSIRGFHVHTANGAALFRGHTDGVNNILTLGGNRLVSTSDDMTIVLWNMRSWSPEITLRGHDRCVSCAALDTTESLLYTAGFDGMIKAWNMTAAVQELSASAAAAPPPPKKKKAEQKKKKK